MAILEIILPWRVLLGSLSGSTLTSTSDEHELKLRCNFDELNSRSKSPAPQSLEHREISGGLKPKSKAVDSMQQGENSSFQRTDRLPVNPADMTFTPPRS